jgi:peptidyl-prolyl cis-trans isomerase D
MLTSMRKHFKKLSLTLWLVIAAFIGTMFLVWSGASNSSKSVERGVIGSVNGLKIYATDHGNMMKRLEQAYKEQLGDNYEQYAKNLNFKDMAMDQMITDKLLMLEAKKLGIGVSDKELIDNIKKIPYFQTNGVFDSSKYKQIASRSGFSESDFENSQRASLIKSKLVDFITASSVVPEDEVRDKYIMDNVKVKGQVVQVKSKDFESEVKEESDEAVLKDYFDKNKEDFKKEEQRKIDFVALNKTDLQKEVTIEDAKIEEYYNAHIDEYKQEEEVKARHILFKVEKDNKESDANAKKKAEEILDKIKKGGDFVELAKQYSQEPGADKSGGDLGWFSRGRMVKPFEEKAFSMKVDEISDIVKTDFGYHIIKVEGKKEPGTKPLSEVKEIIANNLKREKVDDETGSKLALLYKDVTTDKKSLTDAAKERGLTFQQSNLFTKSGEIEGLGRAMKFSQKAFELKLNEVSSPIDDYKFAGIIKLTEIKEPYIPEYDEVKDLVKTNYKKHLSEVLAKEKIDKILKDLKEGTAWANIKEKYGIKDMEDVEITKKNSYVKGVGKVDNIISLAFGMNVGDISEPIQTKNGYLLFKVTSKEMFDDQMYQQKRQEILNSIIESKKREVLDGFIKELKNNAEIKNFISEKEQNGEEG